jgi:flavin reductase (DIM6/NTAB) family NADH-FMN oxidoreductase RutF
MPEGIDGEAFKAAMGSFAAGVTVITTIDAAGKPFGLTATAFSSVSKDPPLCLVCVSLDAEARPVIHATGSFAVNFLASDQVALSAQLARHGVAKFDGVPWDAGPATGSPLLRGVLAAVECTVHTHLRAGDHDVFLGKIVSSAPASGEPLVYFRGRYARIVPI